MNVSILHLSSLWDPTVVTALSKTLDPKQKKERKKESNTFSASALLQSPLFNSLHLRCNAAPRRGDHIHSSIQISSFAFPFTFCWCFSLFGHLGLHRKRRHLNFERFLSTHGRMDRQSHKSSCRQVVQLWRFLKKKEKMEGENGKPRHASSISLPSRSTSIQYSSYC